VLDDSTAAIASHRSNFRAYHNVSYRRCRATILDYPVRRLSKAATVQIPLIVFADHDWGDR
jgi:hypothetical protein